MSFENIALDIWLLVNDTHLNWSCLSQHILEMFCSVCGIKQVGVNLFQMNDG